VAAGRRRLAGGLFGASHPSNGKKVRPAEKIRPPLFVFRPGRTAAGVSGASLDRCVHEKSERRSPIGAALALLVEGSVEATLTKIPPVPYEFLIASGRLLGNAFRRKFPWGYLGQG